MLFKVDSSTSFQLTPQCFVIVLPSLHSTMTVHSKATVNSFWMNSQPPLQPHFTGSFYFYFITSLSSCCLFFFHFTFLSSEFLSSLAFLNVYFLSLAHVLPTLFSHYQLFLRLTWVFFYFSLTLTYRKN